MKSIKPGRGPSMMGAIVCIAIAVFGVLWVIMASDITSSFSGSSSLGGEFVFEEGMTLDTYGSPMNSIGSIFPLFGVIFVVIAIALAVYNLRNATGKNRYSEFDIVDGDEESDPLNIRFGEETQDREDDHDSDAPAFCPYCGNDLEEEHVYCDRCGKKVRS